MLVYMFRKQIIARISFKAITFPMYTTCFVHIQKKTGCLLTYFDVEKLFSHI